MFLKWSLRGFFEVALTETAQVALSINDKHREVQRLGRTAKEIAAEIGKMLIEEKRKMAHGEFKPWVEANCCLSVRRAQEYMKVARLKNADARAFADCETIQDALAPAKPKPTPKAKLEEPTLYEIRVVRKLKEVIDHPSTPEGQRQAAQRPALRCPRQRLLHRLRRRLQPGFAAAIDPVTNAAE